MTATSLYLQSAGTFRRDLLADEAQRLLGDLDALEVRAELHRLEALHDLAGWRVVLRNACQLLHLLQKMHRRYI